MDEKLSPYGGGFFVEEVEVVEEVEMAAPILQGLLYVSLYLLTCLIALQSADQHCIFSNLFNRECSTFEFIQYGDCIID